MPKGHVKNTKKTIFLENKQKAGTPRGIRARLFKWGPTL